MPTIFVVGLGPGGKDYLTLAAVELLQGGAPVILRTEQHPVVPALQTMGISFSTCDDLYQAGASFEAVYQAIADRVLQRAAAGDVVFAVPGHPLCGEEAVQKLLAQAPAQGVTVRLIAAPSFLDALTVTLRLDPVTGLEVIDALDLTARPPAGDLPAILMQVYSRQVASDAKLALLETYPPEHPVTVVRGAGIPEMERVEQVPLHQLDHLAWVDHLTSVYLPPAAERGTRCHPLDPVVAVMARLRGVDGCPWDREQTHATLRRYLIEEAYEAVEAIGRDDLDGLKDELGDVLLQVVFHAQIAQERGDFNIDDVVAQITNKLIRRHPHVFGSVAVKGAADVVRNWEAIKAAEKGSDSAASSILDGVGKGLPALMRAYQVQRKAAGVGFDWSSLDGPLDKLHEELGELRAASEAGDPRAVAAELGDLLFSVVNVARFLSVDPELALSDTIVRFQRRFAHIEAKARAQNLRLDEMSLDQMEMLWGEAKKVE